MAAHNVPCAAYAVLLVVAMTRECMLTVASEWWVNLHCASCKRNANL